MSKGCREGGVHLIPHPEWDVLAACMYGAPAVTNSVDAMDKKNRPRCFQEHGNVRKYRNYDFK